MKKWEDASWQDCYETNFALHTLKAEISTLVGEYEKAENVFPVLFQYASTKQDKCSVYLVQYYFYELRVIIMHGEGGGWKRKRFVRSERERERDNNSNNSYLTVSLFFGKIKAKSVPSNHTLGVYSTMVTGFLLTSTKKQRKFFLYFSSM
jgi:hypothetical protein